MTATNITVKRVCEFCGKEFISQKITTRFCSKECNNKAYKLPQFGIVQTANPGCLHHFKGAYDLLPYYNI